MVMHRVSQIPAENRACRSAIWQLWLEILGKNVLSIFGPIASVEEVHIDILLYSFARV